MIIEYYIGGKLKYEGDYLFNRKWNGKGHDEKGNIIYELKDGNGKVKEYDKYGKLIFEGEYINGIRSRNYTLCGCINNYLDYFKK